MRTVSFFLALVVSLMGPSFAGAVNDSLPGIGTFTYNGAPLISDAPLPMVVAIR